jgi:tRNA dimethylallyltransferase
MILAIVGPTGTGKTAVALALTRCIAAEIVNLDSRQVYRGLDIGSAKPTEAERALAPHHLFDVVEPGESFDCARYRELALRAIAEIEARGRRVLLVGGTGLYLKVLRYGLFAGPKRDCTLRSRLTAMEESEPGILHERLREIDRAAAARVHPHDRARLVRAIEVFELTGRPMTDWQREHGFRKTELEMRVIGLDMERQRLYERLNARCTAMVEAGLIDEVRALRARGYTSDLAPLRSIGYREIGAYLDNRCTLEEALRDMARATRHLAKRQLTWFRGVPDLRWYDVTNVRPEDLAAELTEELLAASTTCGGRQWSES